MVLLLSGVRIEGSGIRGRINTFRTHFRGEIGGIFQLLVGHGRLVVSSVVIV